MGNGMAVCRTPDCWVNSISIVQFELDFMNQKAKVTDSFFFLLDKYLQIQQCQ